MRLIRSFLGPCIGAFVGALALAGPSAPAFAQFGGSPDSQVDYPGDPAAPDAGTRQAPPQGADSPSADAEDDEVYQGAKPGADEDMKPDAGAAPEDMLAPDAGDYAPDDEALPGEADQDYYGPKPDSDGPDGAPLPPKHAMPGKMNAI